VNLEYYKKNDENESSEFQLKVEIMKGGKDG
jgi:hypothetical protein